MKQTDKQRGIRAFVKRRGKDEWVPNPDISQRRSADDENRLQVALQRAVDEACERAQRGRPPRPNPFALAVIRKDMTKGFTADNCAIEHKLYTDLIEGLGYEREDVWRFIDEVIEARRNGTAKNLTPTATPLDFTPKR